MILSSPGIASLPRTTAEQAPGRRPGHWAPRVARPIRVIILYGTVLAKEDGEVLFFDDLYGQDRRLERLLGLAPVRPYRPRRAHREASKLANRR